MFCVSIRRIVYFVCLAVAYPTVTAYAPVTIPASGQGVYMNLTVLLSATHDELDGIYVSLYGNFTCFVFREYSEQDRHNQKGIELGRYGIYSSDVDRPHARVRIIPLQDQAQHARRSSSPASCFSLKRQRYSVDIRDAFTDDSTGVSMNLAMVGSAPANTRPMQGNTHAFVACFAHSHIRFCGFVCLIKGQ